MEMAAMVTNIGSDIITDAKEFIDKIGKPLELDTDGRAKSKRFMFLGIWCLFPSGFPENYVLKTKGGKSLKFSFPCSILNGIIHEKYENPQYQVKSNIQ